MFQYSEDLKYDHSIKGTIKAQTIQMLDYLYSSNIQMAQIIKF